MHIDAYYLDIILIINIVEIIRIISIAIILWRYGANHGDIVRN